ncbi:Hypothetical protein GLP15_1924 [Giardia lamblia P15]|uniref:UDENN domain-containing protein n=1 Tax=Giardia intestinalis (strain P15) TaxID=658858 RepID=E1F625_GIAIA|nr:Hypothetical protein GLP15_1924 [Giardia lamblia P15]
MSKTDPVILYVGVAGPCSNYIKGSYVQTYKRSQTRNSSNLLPTVLVRYPSSDLSDFPFPLYVYNYVFPMGVPILPEKPIKKLDHHCFTYTTARGKLVWGVSQQFALPMGDEMRGIIQSQYEDINVTVQSYSLYSIFVLITEGHLSKFTTILGQFVKSIQSERDFQGICMKIYELFPSKKKLPYTIIIDTDKQVQAFPNVTLTSVQPTTAGFTPVTQRMQPTPKEMSALSQAIINGGVLERNSGRKNSEKLKLTFDRLSNNCFPSVSVNFLTLFSHVSPSAIVDTLEALLQSRTVLFIGKSLSKVSMCVIEMWTLLYPFSYPFPFLPVMSGLQLHILHSPFPVLAGAYKSIITDNAISPLLHVVDVDAGRIVPPYELISSQYGGRLLRYALPRAVISKFPIAFYLGEDHKYESKHTSRHEVISRDVTLHNTFNLEGTDETLTVSNVFPIERKATVGQRKKSKTGGQSFHTSIASSEHSLIPTVSKAYQNLSDISKELQQLVPNFFGISHLCRLITMNFHLFTLSKIIQISYDSNTLQSGVNTRPHVFPPPVGKGIASYATKAPLDIQANKRTLLSKSVNSIASVSSVHVVPTESSNSGDSFLGALQSCAGKVKRQVKKSLAKKEQQWRHRDSLILDRDGKTSSLFGTQLPQSNCPEVSFQRESGDLNNATTSSISSSNIFQVPSLPTIIKKRLLLLINQAARIYVDKSAKGKLSKGITDTLNTRHLPEIPSQHEQKFGLPGPDTGQNHFPSGSDSEEDTIGAQYPNPIVLAIMNNCTQQLPLQAIIPNFQSTNICATYSSPMTLKQDYSVAKVIYPDEKHTYFDYKGYSDEVERLESMQNCKHKEGEVKDLEESADDEEVSLYSDRLQTGFMVILLGLVKNVYRCIRRRSYTSLLVDPNFVQTGASSISTPKFKTDMFHYLITTKDKEQPYYVLPTPSSSSEVDFSSTIFTEESVIRALRKIVPGHIQTNITSVIQESGKYDDVFDYASFLTLLSPEFQRFMRYFVHTPFFEEFLESRLLFPSQLDGYSYHPIFKQIALFSPKHSDSTFTSIASTFSDSCASSVAVPFFSFLPNGNQQQYTSLQLTDCISDTTVMTLSGDEQSSRPSSPVNIHGSSSLLIHSGEMDLVDDIMALNFLHRNARREAQERYSFEFQAFKRGQRRHVWRQKQVTLVTSATKIIIHWRKNDIKELKSVSVLAEIDRASQLRDKDSDDETADSSTMELIPGQYITFVPYQPLLESVEHTNCVCIYADTRLLLFSLKTPEHQRAMLSILMRTEVQSNERLNSEQPPTKFILDTRRGRNKALGHLMNALDNEDRVLKRQLEDFIIDVYSGIPLDK